jgi:hypothetical protein
MNIFAYALLPVALAVVIPRLGAQTSSDHRTQVMSCSSLSLARAGYGVQYQGRVTNDDYGLVMVIPENLTGWGAANVAPFHGFTIYLPGSTGTAACIVFEIHLRVNLGESSGSATSSGDHGYAVAVGNVQGQRKEKAGLIGGIRCKNVLVEFSVRHGTEIFDGSVWLTTPWNTAAKNTAILDEFLSKMRFANGQ